MNFFNNRHPASYRDPAGFIFEEDGIVYRQVNQNYKEQYDHLMSSGLYQRLITEGLLIKHEEVEKEKNEEAFTFLKPDQLDFVCPPYLWTYNMLKEAALLTLKIQQISLQYGMILKDAHPSNVQFIGTKPIFIDSLSFVQWDTTQPWIAYRQFCESFLFPLAIGHYLGPESTKFLRAWPAGVPIQFVEQLLPWKFRLNLHWNLHLHLNSKKSNKQNSPQANTGFSTKRMKNLVESLQIATMNCETRKRTSPWIDYENEVLERGNYSKRKHEIVLKWASEINSKKTILDLGSNTGQYSKLLQNNINRVIQIESDPLTCNTLYIRNQKSQVNNTTTVCIDISELIEKEQLSKSLRSEVVLCLGLLHHLLYRSNFSISLLFNLLSDLCQNYLIIEFIPPDDPFVLRYFETDNIRNRTIFLPEFKKILASNFNIIDESHLPNSSRLIYLCAPK
jgi:hypothetical protein